MTRWTRSLLWLTLLNVVAWGVGRILSRQLSEGDADADEFSIATIFGGTTRRSLAPSLRRGRLLACCGGVDLDLRGAGVDPEGAVLYIRATMGGVQVTVPRDWRVTVAADTRAGGVDTHVAEADALPEGAPSLHVDVVARMGGVLITSGDEPDGPAAT
ncbi:MAG: cell wall-active antibiotics response protein [Thermoleophilia bacterium]|nr:cell wall-active antibiotics response protein [Thermoleophilia bacterium]